MIQFADFVVTLRRKNLAITDVWCEVEVRKDVSPFILPVCSKGHFPNTVPCEETFMNRLVEVSRL